MITNMVQSYQPPKTPALQDCPLEYILYESDGTDEACQIQVHDRGSKPHCANVNVQGVPMHMSGVVDSGADITTMGGYMFKHVIVVVKLRKKYFTKHKVIMISNPSV